MLLPLGLVLLVFLKISNLFGELDLLCFVQTGKHGIAVDGCVEGSFRVDCLVERHVLGDRLNFGVV